MRSGLRACGWAFVLATLAGPAAAQEGFSVELFEPLPAQGHAVLGVSTSRVLGHGQLSVGLFGHYQDDPLTASSIDDRDTVVARLVDSRWTLEASVAFGLFDAFELGVVMPLVLSQSGDDLAPIGRPGESVEGFAVGDLRVVPKVTFLGGDQGFGVHLLVPVVIPTGDAAAFTSDGAVRVRPTLGLDYTLRDGVVAANVGYEIRSSDELATYTNDDALRWALAGRAQIFRERFAIVATVQGSVLFADQAVSDAPTSPIEVMGGVELRFGDLVLSGGAGIAAVRGVGSPDLRGYFGVAWTPLPAPDEPEVIEDTDKDGLLDNIDKCRDFAEDMDGYQDGDGCPDPDDDFDGVPDIADKCPQAAEDYAGPEDGCPTADEPPPVNPDPDDDKILGENDKCPDLAEDVDQFEDADGCPDPDNDGDGVLDGADKCANAVESKNAFQDEDGCPDANEKGVTLTAEAIEIAEQIAFGFGSDKIREKSFPTLDAVARVLQQNPSIVRLSVEGHTDSEGPEASNLDLSTKRAAAVREYLVGKGIAAERVESVGFGEGKPKFPNTTPAGRTANRRVEFRIVAPAGAP